MTDISKDLWKLADEIRTSGVHPNLLALLHAAKARGVNITNDQIKYLVQRGFVIGEYYLPSFIPEFVAACLEEFSPRSILDPWAGIGEMVAPLAKRFRTSVAIGLSPNASSLEAARLLHENSGVDWRSGDPFALLDNIDARFDAIVGCPPWGWKPRSISLPCGDTEVALEDDSGNLLMLKASMRLEPEGSGFFLLSPGFLAVRNQRGVRNNIRRFGLFVHAALSLPKGTFSPGTQVGATLVVIRRKRPDRMFVGELTPDHSRTAVLLKNMRESKEGQVPQLGVLVDPDSFRTFESLAAEREIAILAQESGLRPVPLAAILKEEVGLTDSKKEEFPEKPNTVYLPLIGRSPAVSSSENFRLKPHNYAQLVLDSDKAAAAYVANFFNSTLGQKIRESLFSGVTIPKITKSLLSGAQVYLPDLKTQVQSLGVESVITELSTQLDTLRRQLWNYPLRAKNIGKALKSLNRENDFETWMDSLPFPLASIIWAYHADPDIEHKISHLFHFFEALAEFTATVLLSCFAADKGFYTEECGAWIESDPKFKDWFVTSNFGGWRILGERLAKAARRLLSDEKRQRCLELFGFPDPDFLEVLINKGQFAILSETNEYRDRWKGHGGVASPQDSRDHLTLLEDQLSKVRQLLSDRYSTALFLSPESCDYTEGVFTYQVKALMGSRSLFKKVTVRTLLPMDTRKLYILHSNQLRPVELLPFVRIMESPRTQQNACYFYNSIDGEKVRWISYHFESEAELLRPDSEVKTALELLLPQANERGTKA